MTRLKMTFVLGLRYLILTRYSWLTALVLVLIVPVSLVMAPELLANLFVLDLPEQIYHISWLSMWCAATVMETLSVTTLNAHERFDDYQLSIKQFRKAWNVEEGDETGEWYRTSGGFITFVLGLIAALSLWHLIVEACITRTVDDYTLTWDSLSGAMTPNEFGWICWRRALAGLATTMLVLGVVNGVLILLRERRKRLEANSDPTDDQPAWQRSLYRGLHFVLGPGYFREHEVANHPDVLHVAPGHLRMMAYTFTFMVWHAVNYVTVRASNQMPSETSPYAALFYGLLTLLVFSYVLPGAAFYLDRYRIPVPLLMLGAVLMIYAASRTDHYYELNPPREQTAAAESARDNPYVPLPLEAVYENWQWPLDIDGTRTLVVVDASGGGIQASAWTAQVLTGLHERYGNSFSRSIGLISGVSGGSVGTMFYLANRADLLQDYEPADDYADEDELEQANVLPGKAILKIREVSRASALEAAAWGIAYPDLMRLVFAPAANPTLDRGWATEQIWRQRLKTAGPHVIDHSDLRLSDLGRACRDNQLPVPVFNATLLESGQRLQISPALGPTTDYEPPASAVQFMSRFPEVHLRATTAARLSATFPYVTPAARSNPQGNPHRNDTVASYHIVDGAYVDNEGVVTSVDWLHRLLGNYNRHVLDRPFDRVLLIRIQAFPKKTRDNPGPRVNPTSGWRSAIAGPIEAMMRVRSNSQIERGDLEISLLEEANREHVMALRNHYQSELTKAETRVNRAQQTWEALGRITPDDAQTARQVCAANDKLRFAQSYRDETRDRMYEAASLQLVQVLFDFPPSDVRIPMSWKLTKEQKQSIDFAWRRMVGDNPHPSIRLLDEYFAQNGQPAEPQ